MKCVESLWFVAILINAVDVCCYVEYAYYVIPCLLRLTKSRVMLLSTQVVYIHVSVDVICTYRLMKLMSTDVTVF